MSVREGENGPRADGVVLGDRLRVGVAGLGVIGEGAALKVLGSPSSCEFAGALVNDLSKARHEEIDREKLVDGIDEFLAFGLHVVFDALSDGETGAELTEKALSRGVHVVSANKQAIAGSLAHLHALATSNGAALLYEASVGGGAPMIETLRQARLAGEVSAMEAIVNGTVNFILSEMAAGADFDGAVKAAQQAGFAEADPSADLSGLDARAKGSILSFEAWDKEPVAAAFDIEPLTKELAADLAGRGGVWRQITRIDHAGGAPGVRVSFEQVDDDELFAGALGEANALRVRLVGEAELTCRGLGAGRAPTVASMLGDLSQISRLSTTK